MSINTLAKMYSTVIDWTETLRAILKYLGSKEVDKIEKKHCSLYTLMYRGSNHFGNVDVLAELIEKTDIEMSTENWVILQYKNQVVYKTIKGRSR